MTADFIQMLRGRLIARITRFVEPDQQIGRCHPTKVSCGRGQVRPGGEPFLNLETYGSTRRKSAGKISRSIQIDRDTAILRKHLLVVTFPGI